MAWLLQHGVLTHQLKQNSSPAERWANCIPLGPHAQQMNEHFVSLLHFWLGPCSIPRLRFIFQASELFTLIKSSQICLQTVSEEGTKTENI